MSDWQIEKADGFHIIYRGNSLAVYTKDWAEQFRAAFELFPNIAVIGAKRIDTAKKIFSMGEFLIHSKSYHLLGHGYDIPHHVFPEEVDVISGGLLAVSDEWFEKNEPKDLVGDLACIDLCLDMRMLGGRVIGLPHVLVEDQFYPQPSSNEEEVFLQKWGFDWQLPRLSIVRERYRGTGILWNVHFHPEMTAFEKYDQRGAFHWQAYADNDVFKGRADLLCGQVRQIAKAGSVLDFGCGDGLMSHLAAQDGATVIGIDLEEVGVKLARSQTADCRYPGAAPEFILGTCDPLQFADESFDTVMMLDVIEHLSDPIEQLCDIRRVLARDGILYLTTPEFSFYEVHDPYHIAEYTKEELVRQVSLCGFKLLACERVPPPYHDIIGVFQKIGD